MKYRHFPALLLSTGAALTGMAGHAGTACPPISLASLKQEIDTCIGRDEGQRNYCIIRSLHCADTRTTANGLATDVSVLLIFSTHREQFYVDQNHYHYREVIFPGKTEEVSSKEFQVGIGYHFTIKQVDASDRLTGTVQGVAAELGVSNPRTMSYVALIGIDPLQPAGEALYRTLGSATAKTSISDYLDSYTKVDTEFSGIYKKLLGKDSSTSGNVRVCPQVIAARNLDGSPDATPFDLAGSVRTGLGAEVESALCGPVQPPTRRPSAVFLYAFTTSSATLGAPATGGNATGTPNAHEERDQVLLAYARRRFFATKHPLDLHTEYYAAGRKGSFGTGALVSAMFSLSGASEDIQNKGYAFGYPACMDAVPVDYSLGRSAPLAQLQGLASLYDAFNSNMGQIDAWARSNTLTGCGGATGSGDNGQQGIKSIPPAGSQPPAPAAAPSTPTDARSSSSPVR
jgi:hypothetical protein